MKISLDQLIIINFFFVIIFFPVNYKIISFIRPSDLMMLLFSFLLVSRIEIKQDYLLFILLSVFLILISTLASMGDYKQEFLGSSIYIYKLIIIYLTIMGTYFVCAHGKIVSLNKLLFSLFLILIVYAFIYSVLLYFDLIIGNLRISYPFTGSEDRIRSDAHLYGNYLALNLIAYVLYWKKKFNHSFITSISIQLFCIAAIILTGSKNPILILSLFYFGLLIIYIYNNIIKKINVRIIIYISLFYIFIYLFTYLFEAQINNLYLILIDFIYTNQYHLLVTRIYFFILSPFTDDSALGRINNLIYALEISKPYYFVLGRGLNGEFRFFDGIHSIIIAIGGFSLLLVFAVNIFLILGKIIFINKINTPKIIFAVFFIFLIISNLITEFIFVTRWMIPNITIATLLYFTCFYDSEGDKHNVS